jgi:hypothetical protein
MPGPSKRTFDFAAGHRHEIGTASSGAEQAFPAGHAQEGRRKTSKHQLGLGVDQDGAVHVDVQLEALAGAFDVVRLDLRHHLGASEQEGAPFGSVPIRPLFRPVTRQREATRLPSSF